MRSCCVADAKGQVQGASASASAGVRFCRPRPEINIAAETGIRRHRFGLRDADRCMLPGRSRTFKEFT
jgi:hypothetical protein